ncbi:MAG: TRAM domain-containing protein [Terrimicrobiaceae bacterium]|nr:TRAM domain-containing protein [Terrimicrobiaceae bacterium]
MESTITIERVAFGGSGLGRLPDGRVCFVPGTLPGERAIVRLVREKKSYAEAELVRLVESSPRRVRPGCPVFGTCGGCTYQHAAYDLQLEIKTGQVSEVLRRLGRIADPDVRPTLPSPATYGYRNRISVHVQHGRVGYHRVKSRSLVEVSHCPIAAPAVNDQLAALAARPPHRDGRITLRAPSTHRGFSQVNDGAAEVLAAAVTEMLPGRIPHFVDAYCGAGFFIRALRGRFERATGIEWSHPAIEAARANAAENETFLEGPVESHLGSVLASAPDAVVLVDPPAEGLEAAVIETLENQRPGRLIYVSCDPATLARDVARLANTHAPQWFQPVDMFPQTAEIEVAALLTVRS